MANEKRIHDILNCMAQHHEILGWSNPLGSGMELRLDDSDLAEQGRSRPIQVFNLSRFDALRRALTDQTSKTIPTI
jgi:hypothetical protein